MIPHKKLVFTFTIGIAILAGAAWPQVPAQPASTSTWNVLDFGATPDGATDCAASFQKAMDTAAAAKGGIVIVPTGRYSFSAPLNVPAEVTLRGVYSYSPSHAGIRDAGDLKPEYGTTLLVRTGAGDENAPPFITLNSNSALAGVCVYYPDQKPEGPVPTPYPYAVVMRGNNPAIIDVELVNPYNAIDASKNQRALVRNVHGQPLHIGIYVNEIYDIGRIENVHWNPWWSMQTELFKWQMENGTGFIFERTDWHYVVNTFCFGYNVGYKFGQSKAGTCNGNFLGIGADDCYTSVLIEQSAPMGVLITNGEFVAFHGAEPTMVRVTKEHTGSVRFSNCAFWGPCNQNAVIDGKGTIGFSDCTFMQWGHREPVLPAIDVLGGSVLIRGCEFKEDKPQIRLRDGVHRAIVTDNIVKGAIRIEQAQGIKAVIQNNLGE
jgi:hypothetical protein